jgi:glycosyltransferase involved in cell wall biosynthesis
MTAERTGTKKPRTRRTAAKSGSAGKSASEPRVQVSVIVPARDEEAALPACLASIVSQQGVAFEVIVVDDHSSDRTADIARSFQNVKLVSAPPLPEGWCGKQNALHAGVQSARGEWLLFTDADTIHLPGSLARALQEAHEFEADLLSYSPAQDVETFAERALMPVVFSDLADTYRPADVCNPASAMAAANGQYLLIKRAAYDAVGGHAACANTLLEDVALARRVKQAGGRLRFRFGGDAVHTRMYRSFGDMREGWTKNLALLFPDARDRAVRRAGEFALIAGSALAAVAAARRGHRAISLLAGLIAGGSYAAFRRRIQRAHFGPAAELAAIAGLPLFAYLLARSDIFYRSGKPIAWKGRTYEGRS